MPANLMTKLLLATALLGSTPAMLAAQSGAHEPAGVDEMRARIEPLQSAPKIPGGGVLLGLD
jgi:hypothetical protein